MINHSSIQTITSEAELQSRIERLIVIEPQFANAYEKTGLPTLRLRDSGFPQLLKTIVSQQLSVAAADSIWQKLHSADLISESAIINADEEILRSNGLSKQKIRYAKSLAHHQIDYHALAAQPDEQVIQTLTAVTGIGRWTAEIYLLFSLYRSDVFAANDLALQVAYQQLFEIDTRPNEKSLRHYASAWQPERSTAAYLLWSYYHYLKKREGVGV